MTSRGNGLRASAYTVLIEIEESLGDRLLEALAERQIAAYVVPAAGPGGGRRLILHVDAERRIPASIVLAGLTPALAGELPADGEQPPDGSLPAPSAGQLADDAIFAELVETFNHTPAERSWPAAEDLPPAPTAPTAQVVVTYDPPAGADRHGPVRPSPPTADAAAPNAAAEDEADDVADHYTPPPLPRLAPPPRVTRWALAALGIGLALLLFPTLLAFGHRTSLDVAGVACMLGSAAILLSRLRDRAPDDPDDGAVV